MEFEKLVFSLLFFSFGYYKSLVCATVFVEIIIQCVTSHREYSSTQNYLIE